MTRIRLAVRRAMDKLFPWPARAERKAAIAQARGNRQAAEARAESAADLQAQIRRIVAENHFAETIAAQLAQGRRHRGEGA